MALTRPPRFPTKPRRRHKAVRCFLYFPAETPPPPHDSGARVVAAPASSLARRGFQKGLGSFVEKAAVIIAPPTPPPPPASSLDLPPGKVNK